jgi:hypothetical protein
MPDEQVLTHEAIDRALAARLDEIQRVVPAERRRAAITQAYHQADALRAVLRKRSGQRAEPHRCEAFTTPRGFGFRCY